MPLTHTSGAAPDAMARHGSKRSDPTGWAAASAALLLVLTGCDSADEEQDDDPAADMEDSDRAEEGDGDSAVEQQQRWFEDQCPVLVVELEGGEGEASDDAALGLLEGPIRPPADLSESTEHVGIYSHDEVSDELVYEREVESGDVLCMLDQEDYETPTNIGEDTIRDFPEDERLNRGMTWVTHPEYEEGVWVEYRPQPGAEGPLGLTLDTGDEECPKGWAAATDMFDVDEAEQADGPVSSSSMDSRTRCE